MVHGIRTIFPRVLSNEFYSKFYEGSRVWDETPEEVQRTHRPKLSEYNKADEDNCPNTLSNKLFFFFFVVFSLLIFFSSVSLRWIVALSLFDCLK